MNFGRKYGFFYGKKVQISSTLGEGCHPSWTNGKNLNFCSDGCESVKTHEKRTHVGGKRRQKDRKEALNGNVNFASVLKH